MTYTELQQRAVAFGNLQQPQHLSYIIFCSHNGTEEIGTGTDFPESKHENYPALGGTAHRVATRPF